MSFQISFSFLLNLNLRVFRTRVFSCYMGLDGTLDDKPYRTRLNAIHRDISSSSSADPSEHSSLSDLSHSTIHPIVDTADGLVVRFGSQYTTGTTDTPVVRLYQTDVTGYQWNLHRPVHVCTIHILLGVITSRMKSYIYQVQDTGS